MASPPGRIALATGGLLLHVLPGVPVSPLSLLTGSPVVEQIVVDTGTTSRIVDLYRPAYDEKHPAIIFSLGLRPNYRDEMLLELADALARLGVVVAIPHSPALDDNRLDPNDVDALVDMFQALQQRDDVNQHRVGFAGFCIGSSLAAVAASEERIRDEVSFLHLFGGYDDLRELVIATTSGTVIKGEEDISWVPGQLGFAVLSQHLIQSLNDPVDTALLTRLFAEDRPSSTYIEELSAQGRTVYGLLMSQDAAATNRLLSQLPLRDQTMLQRLSPSASSGHISARVFIISDSNDPFIPVTQTRQLAAHLAEETSTDYTEFTLFQHVHIGQQMAWPQYVSEVSRLYGHLYGVLAEIHRGSRNSDSSQAMVG